MMLDDEYFFSGISTYRGEKIVSHANNEKYFLKRQEEIDKAKNKRHEKVILMHSKDTGATCKWYPWFKEQMEKRRIEVHIPELPNSDNPKISEWLPILRSFSPDEDTVLVGHARGGVAILRYLERLPEGRKIKKIILLAVNTGSAKYITIQSESIFGFYTEAGYDFEKIKSHCSDFVVMHSKDDELVPFEHGEQTAEGLNARFIKFKNKGHFGEDNGIVPGLIKEVVKV